MRCAVLIDVVRSPTGLRRGQLSGWHPADLAGEVLAALTSRNDFDPARVDDVIMGCAMQVGAQGLNVARNAVLGAGWPHSIPATTIDRESASSLQAAHFAAQGVLAGGYDIVVAGGVEMMSVVPPGATTATSFGSPFGPRLGERYRSQGGLLPPGVAAERLAVELNLTREELDAYAAMSHQRAASALGEQRFSREVVAVARQRHTTTGRAVPTMASSDECVPAAAATLAALKPAFEPGGRITAGNMAQIADGASASLIMEETTARQLGCTPRARFVAFAVAGADPLAPFGATVAVTTQVLARAGLTLADMAVLELHEAFAAEVLAWSRTFDVDVDRVNVNGGAIALGHPVGASGTNLLATLLCELERRQARYGLQIMSAGAMANALVIERLG